MTHPVVFETQKNQFDFLVGVETQPDPSQDTLNAALVEMETAALVESETAALVETKTAALVEEDIAASVEADIAVLADLQCAGAAIVEVVVRRDFADTSYAVAVDLEIGVEALAVFAAVRVAVMLAVVACYALADVPFAALAVVASSVHRFAFLELELIVDLAVQLPVAVTDSESAVAGHSTLVVLVVAVHAPFDELAETSCH